MTERPFTADIEKVFKEERGKYAGQEDYFSADHWKVDVLGSNDQGEVVERRYSTTIPIKGTSVEAQIKSWKGNAFRVDLVSTETKAGISYSMCNTGSAKIGSLEKLFAEPSLPKVVYAADEIRTFLQSLMDKYRELQTSMKPCIDDLCKQVDRGRVPEPYQNADHAKAA